MEMSTIVESEMERHKTDADGCNATTVPSGLAA